jgi:hypothetical protein
MGPEEVSSFWEWEQHEYVHTESLRPLLLKDIYRAFVESRLTAVQEDWDNLSSDRYFLDPNAGYEYEDWELERARHNHALTELERRAHLSFEDCAALCADMHDCFQFRFQKGICAYAQAFMLGKPMRREYETGMRWRSGWNLDRIKAWVEEQGECEQALWPEI